MRPHASWISISFVLLVTFSMAALAQDTGQITGTVKDPSGAAIVNAQVTVSSPERGIKRLTNTNAQGDYLVGGLPPGSFNLSISAPGFKRYEANGIVLRVGQKTRADASLQVGGLTTEVTVQGTGIGNIETQSSDLAGTVTGKQITQLELNGRNFTQLATLVPGVSNQTGQDEGTVGVYGNVSFSFNGGRTEYNNWEIDGGDNMDNGSNDTLNVYPSIDAIDEVRVLTSNYGAQYGRNGSGTVETEVKSGTSSFHGDVYEFLRNDDFNANNYFNNFAVPPVPRPEYKKNDFGYTLGGPIYIPGVYNTQKDKTFFFWSQEWRRDRVPGTVFNVPVPSVAERSGNFSDVCPDPSGSFADCPHVPGTATSANPIGTLFPGNVVPVNSNGALFLPLIPEPNAGDSFILSPVQPTNWREELLRVDHNINSKIRASFHYIHDSWDTITSTPLWTNGGSFPTIETNFQGPGMSMVARVTANVSSTLLNEFVASYTTDHIIVHDTGYPNPNAWQRPASMTIGSLFPVNNVIPGINLMNASGSQFNFVEDAGWIPNGPYNSNPTYTLRDNVTKIVSRHNLQFGVFAAFRQKNELSYETSAGSTNGYLTFNATSAVSTGNPFADLLMGNVYTFGQQNTALKYYNRAKSLEPYFQDDWRVTDKLTLNLGLRVSMFGTYRERYHNAYNFDPAAFNPATAPTLNPDGSLNLSGGKNEFDGIVQCGVNGVPAGCMKGHLFNPAPRIGFAYDLTGKGKTAIRGGYGIFYEQTNGNEGNTETLEDSPPGVLTTTQVFTTPFAPGTSGYSSIGSHAPGASTPVFPLAVMSIPTRVQWPYVQQWHLDVQHQFLKNTVATLSYVGSKGTHLTRQIDLNQIPPLPLALDPYAAGQPITPGSPSPDCGSSFNALGVPTAARTPTGVPITGQAAINLAVAACGADPDFFRPFQGFSDIAAIQDKASSIYHALEAGVRHNVGSLQLNFAYTYSHSIDDSSDRYDSTFVNSYDIRASRASSNFDQRHLLNAGYVYDLPFFKNPGLSNRVLGGWQISGITTWSTGTPFSVTDAVFSDNAGVGNGVSSSGSYVDVVGNPTAMVGIIGISGPFLYNPAAFALPRGLTFGDTARNFLRNPSHTNFDMALLKHFAIKEKLNVEFRAEAFNVFNHTSWQPINGGAGSAFDNNGTITGTAGLSCSAGPDFTGGGPCLGTSNFLNVTAAHNPRILQLGLKVIF